MLEAAIFLNKYNMTIIIFVLYLENLVKNIRTLFVSNILISSTKNHQILLKLVKDIFVPFLVSAKILFLITIQIKLSFFRKFMKVSNSIRYFYGDIIFFRDVERRIVHLYCGF